METKNKKRTDYLTKTVNLIFKNLFKVMVDLLGFIEKLFISWTNDTAVCFHREA